MAESATYNNVSPAEARPLFVTPAFNMVTPVVASASASASATVVPVFASSEVPSESSSSSSSLFEVSDYPVTFEQAGDAYLGFESDSYDAANASVNDFVGFSDSVNDENTVAAATTWVPSFDVSPYSY